MHFSQGCLSDSRLGCACAASEQALPGGRYALALSYLNEDFMFQLEGVHLEQAQNCQAPLLLNLAACHLRLEDYAAAEHNCSQARAAECHLVLSPWRPPHRSGLH